MSELFDTRAQSHAARQSLEHQVYITEKGVSYTPPPPPPGLLSKAGDVAMSAGEAVVDAAMDPVGTAKATGRAVAGGLRDFSQGVIDLSSELGGMIETNVGSLGYLNVDENGVNWSKEAPAGVRPGHLGDLPNVPKGNSMAEGLARGLVQFGAGMAAAPVRGAGMGANMLRSGFADALLNPEEGNLSSLLKGMGLDYAVLDYLDSKVDSDAGPEERLKARILQAVEGTAIGVPIDVVMYGFRLIRSNKEAVEEVKETLAQAPPPTDTQVMPDQSFFDKAGEATDNFVTQAATTTDEVATSAARATDEFVSKVEPSPDASYDGGKIAGDGKLSSKAQDAASKLSEEFGVDFNVSNHPTSYGNSTYVSGRIAGPEGTFVDVGFRLSDHSTGDKRKATDNFLTIIDDGEVTSETLVAEVQGQLDRALPKMQKMSDDRKAKAIAQSDALSRWSELSGDERGEIAVKFNETRPKGFNNVPWKNLTKQQKADFAAREGLDKD